MRYGITNQAESSAKCSPQHERVRVVGRGAPPRRIETWNPYRRGGDTAPDLSLRIRELNFGPNGTVNLLIGGTRPEDCHPQTCRLVVKSAVSNVNAGSSQSPERLDCPEGSLKILFPKILRSISPGF